MKISIVVTVYNIEKYIGKCLDSIKNQTYELFECIVVNDGSTDKSKDIIEEFKKDSRFKIIDKINGGVSSARNIGIDTATGEYIIFVDGDDYLDKDMLKHIVGILKEKKADTIFSGYKGVYENYEIASTEVPQYNKDLYIGGETKILLANLIGYSYDDLYNKLNGAQDSVKREFASVWRFVYNLGIIKNNNIGFDEKIKFGEDIIFNSVYLSLCERIYISKYSDYNYIYRSDGLVQTFLHEDGEELLNHKLILMEARSKATEQIYQNNGTDISDMWQGSIIFSCMHVGLSLANMKNKSFVYKYSNFKKYASHAVCKKAFSKLNLKKVGIKYKLCFGPVKKHLYLLEYVMLSVANKLGVSPGVEG